jgi:antirestriction protein ArdC
MKESAYQLITGRIIMLLQQGIVPWRQPWKTRRAWPRNLVSKRRYQGINAFLLHAMRYESPHWLTFYQARQLGGIVRKHEKATPVVLWKRLVVEDAATGEKQARLLLRYWSVFNVAQCEGLGRQVSEPQAVAAATDPIAAANSIVDNMPNRPSIKHGFAQAFYAMGEDYIGMPLTAAFENQDDGAAGRRIRGAAASVDVAAWRIRCPFRSGSCEFCPFFHPVALIYGTNTRSERSMVRGACAFRSGKQSAREHCETR